MLADGLRAINDFIKVAQLLDVDRLALVDRAVIEQFRHRGVRRWFHFVIARYFFVSRTCAPEVFVMFAYTHLSVVWRHNIYLLELEQRVSILGWSVLIVFIFFVPALEVRVGVRRVLRQRLLVIYLHRLRSWPVRGSVAVESVLCRYLDVWKRLGPAVTAESNHLVDVLKNGGVL